MLNQSLHYKEFLLALFVLSGPIKILLPVSSLALNIGILILMSACLAEILWRFRLSQRSLIVFLTFICILLAYYIPNAFYSYSTEKFAMLLFCAVMVFLLVESKSISQGAFVRWLVVLAIILSVIFIYFFSKYQLGQPVSREIATSYLNVAYHLGFVIILLIYDDRFGPWIKYPLLFFFLAVMLYSGARGPVIFLALSIIFLFYEKFSARNIAVFLLLLIALLALVWQLDMDYHANRFYSRFQYLFNLSSDKSLSDRASLVVSLLDYMNSNYFPQGVGGVATRVLGSDSKVYPHNILIELFIEFGALVSVLFVVGVVAYMMLLLFQKKFYLASLFFYLFLNSLKSFSLEDNRLLFICFFWCGIFFQSHRAWQDKYLFEILRLIKRNRNERYARYS